MCILEILYLKLIKEIKYYIKNEKIQNLNYQNPILVAKIQKNTFKKNKFGCINRHKNCKTRD